VNNLAYSAQRLAYSFKLIKCLYELNEKFKTKSEKHNSKVKTFLLVLLTGLMNQTPTFT
jgi:hypothetical protein